MLMYRVLPFSILALGLIPTLLGAAELTIDHVTVAGKDLKVMQASLAAAGLRCEYGGPHQNHATEMAQTSFPDGSYLELIALQPNADPKAVAAHQWANQMQHNAGPCAWAVRPKDTAAEASRLRAAGVAVGELIRNGRSRPDGVRLDWETAQVGQEPNGSFFPFLIRDFTPRQARAIPTGKPTTTDFPGVAKVVIAVRNLDVSVKRYRDAYTLKAPMNQADEAFGARLAWLPDTPVILAQPLNTQSWLAARLEQFGEGPCAFVLGRRAAGAYNATSHSRWFGSDVSWFDSEKLGWRLGFE
jgi:Glyoxalase-like domain